MARGFFPRRAWWFVMGVALAGTLADVDLLAELFGPKAYLSWRHTYTHSILGTVVVIAIAAGVSLLLRAKSSPTRKPIRDAESAPQKGVVTKEEGIATLLAATTLAAVVHVLMDLATSSGVELLWPVGETRFAWDWLPRIDPWILVVPLAGTLVPELFGLVGSEIGAKSKTPRGRDGALAALALLVIYVGARATLHGNAAAQLDAHTYRGESPRRVAAFADPVSLVTWRGLVETSTQICTMSVPAMGTRFDPEGGVCVYKPEDSIFLQAAGRTETVKQFLKAARFPKASVGATEDGTEVMIRDARHTAEEEKRFAVAVRVLLDRKGRVTRQEILWASEIRLR